MAESVAFGRWTAELPLLLLGAVWEHWSGVLGWWTPSASQGGSGGWVVAVVARGVGLLVQASFGC